ncbi:MAG: peptide chain release factor N(5)-glutamine methyltransferase [Longimicrobiales bacterium]
MSGERHTTIPLTRLAAERLARQGLDNARLEAELLLAAVLEIRRLDLYLQHERPLTADEVASYRDAVRRRLRREPLQYITGEAAFRELVLRVDPRVLIPRPETEVLVEEVLRWCHEQERGLLTALDIGTGSGAIAISLALEGPFERIVATDISGPALELAASNAAAAGAAHRIEFREGSLWQALGGIVDVDVIVSNPPYVAERDRASLQPDVSDWEPAAALFAGEDGLTVLRALIDGAARYLRSGGLLALEVGVGQAATLVERAQTGGEYRSVRVAQDLAGRERFILLERR